MEKDHRENWYVITGTSSSGKTTIIDMLSKRGYKTIPEFARVHIDAGLEKGYTIEDIRKDNNVFQRQVLCLQIEAEKALSEKGVIFFDRGIPDSLAYYRLGGQEGDAYIKHASDDAIYRKVFLLDMLDYQKDYARTETQEERVEIQKSLEKVYKEGDFEVIHVPVMDTKEGRVEFILANIDKRMVR